MISILIRNKNEGDKLKIALQSIKNQLLYDKIEIVIIDDDSSDNSVEIANEFNCRVIPLVGKFSYGYALNFGIKYCSNEIILLLSSHNILLSNDFVTKLIQYFENSNVAAVRCTPVANMNQIKQSLIEPLLIVNENYNNNKDWGNLIIANCSAIRKEVATKIIFNETIRSNEEKLWSLDVLNNGYSIISNTQCYYLYDKSNNSTAGIRDIISKYQIDGIKPLPIFKYLIDLIKLLPWSIKIISKILLNNLNEKSKIVFIPYKYKKGIYK